MTRLEQARARDAKVRAIRARLEDFLIEYIAETGDRPTIVLSTLFEFAFESLIENKKTARDARRFAEDIMTLVCLKHHYDAQTNRYLSDGEVFVAGSRTAIRHVN